MFYEAVVINEHLICPYCKKKFTDPRIVQCSSSFCMQCIELLVKDGENGFKCPVCDEFHEKPKTGFLLNANLAKLCEIKPNKVERGPLADALNTQLDEMKLKLNKLSNENNLGVDKIRQYCDLLRNEVQLSSEELIESIKAHNLELIEQINAYEKSSILDFNKENKIELDIFVQEMSGFHSKWADYLKEIKLDDTDLKMASTQANKCLSKINKVNEQILDKVFDGNVLKFDENSARIASSIFGTLSFNKGDTKSSSISSLKQHQLPNFSSLNEPISVKLLNVGKIVLAYRAISKKDIKVKIFDENFNQLSERICVTGRNFKTFELNAMANGSVILCLTNLTMKLSKHDKSDDEENYDNQTDTLSVIKHYDDKLKILNRICLYYNVCSVDTFENKLYCLSRHGFLDMCMHVYDEKLMNLMNIESNPFEPFYIPCHVNKVQVCESYFVYRDDSEVVLLDRKSGLVKKRFKFEGNEVLFDSGTSMILAYSNETNKVVGYDFEGESKVMDVNIINPSQSIQFVDCSNGKLLFWDSKSDCLYF